MKVERRRRLRKYVVPRKYVEENKEYLTKTRMEYKIFAYTFKMETSRHHKMEELAKELGMTNMAQYVSYCMNMILEAHTGEET